VLRSCRYPATRDDYSPKPAFAAYGGMNAKPGRR